MSTKVWEDIKKGVEDSITFATEKTKELTTISKLKLAISGIKRRIDVKFRELGKLVYGKLEEGELAALTQDEQTKELIKEIKELEAELRAKEEELEVVGKKEEQTEEKSSEEKAIEPSSESD
ncbi:MAG: hypothetical protein V3U73_08975 [bacterium]